MANLTYDPLTSTFGAEVRGLDIRKPITPEVRQSLEAAMNRYSVLLVRDQHNEPVHLRQLAESFGPIDHHPAAKFSIPGAPGVLVISNGSDANGAPIGIRDIGQFWHTDGSYLPTPHACSVLQGIAIPERDGIALGDTIFASTAAAYAALSSEMKARLEDLKVVHSYSYRCRRGERRAAGRSERAERGRPTFSIR